MTGDTQFVTLGVNEEVFAVPVGTVREILDMQRMFRLPEAPSYLAGLIDVRGRPVPAIDLRVKLGLPATTATQSTRILVLDIPLGERLLTIGLIADRVFEVVSFTEDEMELPPDIGLSWRSDYIKGVTRRNGGFVIVFDLARLFSSSEAAFIGAAAQATEAA
jgi:purine-binding chemotaxis protein CheW